eukprot:COSAG06_NODE_3283_length_5558_cov_2.577761_3_plen_48_part_00
MPTPRGSAQTTQQLSKRSDGADPRMEGGERTGPRCRRSAAQRRCGSR